MAWTEAYRSSSIHDLSGEVMIIVWEHYTESVFDSRIVAIDKDVVAKSNCQRGFPFSTNNLVMPGSLHSTVD